MKTNKNRLLTIVASGVSVASVASADALTAPTFGTGDVTTVAGALLVGLAAIWGISKALGMAKRF